MKIIMEIDEQNLGAVFGCAKSWVDICGKVWFIAETYFIEPTTKGHVRIGIRLIGITAKDIETDGIQHISMGDFFQYSVDVTDED